MEKDKVELYFRRIGLEMPETFTADGEFLEKIFHAQVTHVPYENTDYLNGERDEITVERLFRQVVTERRGGICYELNAFLGEVLNTLGYEAYPVMADHYRTHMEGTNYRHSGLIVKDCSGVMWFSDVGDSFSGALKPLLLCEDVVQYPGNEPYYFKKREDGSWMLYVRPKDEWIENYAFWEKPASLEELTYYKNCYMDSGIRFATEELFHIRTDSGYRLLRGRTFCVKNGSEKIVRTIDDSELESVYGVFGLKFPISVYKEDFDGLSGT